MTALSNKVAIVVGSGGTGSGRAVARRFAAEGAHVVVSDRDASGAAEAVSFIKADGGQAIARVCDVRDEKSVKGLVAFTEEQFGHIDVLVNTASRSDLFKPSQPLEFWDEIITTDLLGTLWLTRSAIAAMARRGRGGAVVNFSSTSAFAHGHLKDNGSPAYDVAKMGIARVTTMLGFLGPKENIRVNCIAPDWIAVPELLGYFNSLTPEERAANGVPSRLTTPEEIAGAVLRLATDEKLYGRVMVWWSDEEPGLIRWGDNGYTALE
jgi:NAD(P)-dependent dehydrogenase (short-subunit alcohol dehydrogenase family)